MRSGPATVDLVKTAAESRPRPLFCSNRRFRGYGSSTFVSGQSADFVNVHWFTFS